MSNGWLVAGGASGFLAVAAGAFGAHALADIIAPNVETYRTAAQYHLIHSLALVVVGLLRDRRQSMQLSLAAWSFLAGIVLFSGSLYALALSGIRQLGAITPLGGVAFLGGWLALAWTGLSQRRNATSGA